MAQQNLKMFATSLAMYARKELAATPRGSLLIRMVADGSVIAGVYGNANYVADPKARQEVEVVRQRLKAAGIEVKQFGLSLDGHTWALLVHLDDRAFQTEAGKAMYREMLKVQLDDIVQGTYQTVFGVASDPPAPPMRPVDSAD
jgi:hypothetical protein